MYDLPTYVFFCIASLTFFYNYIKTHSFSVLSRLTLGSLPLRLRSLRHTLALEPLSARYVADALLTPPWGSPRLMASLVRPVQDTSTQASFSTILMTPLAFLAMLQRPSRSLMSVPLSFSSLHKY